jgi:hypothetical protein
MAITQILRYVNQRIRRLCHPVNQLSTTHALKPTNIAKSLQISRQAVYRWLNGEMSSTRIAGHVNSVLSTTFPARLEGKYLAQIKKYLFD